MVKFVDRVFLSCIAQVGEFLRSIVVHVDSESPEPLWGLDLLLPCPYECVRSVKDVSETCLLDPAEYHFNSVHTLGYRVQSRPDPGNQAGIGKIDTDGFENVEVYTGSAISVNRVADSTLIQIRFKDAPIEAGAFREIRLLLLQEIRSEEVASSSPDKLPWQRIALPYLEKTQTADARELLSSDERELPVRPICDANSLQGGFDVFIYLPQACEYESWTTRGVRFDKYGIDGKEHGEISRKLLWRMRWALEESRAWTLEQIAERSVDSQEVEFTIEGLLRPGPTSLEAQKTGYEQVKRGTLVIGWVSFAALVVAILGFVLIMILLLRG